MENSSRFFKNDACAYFPCHKTENAEEFNCLFCFCPLYSLEDCGGNFTFTENGVKDCSACTLPHNAEKYAYIMDRLKRV